MFTVEIAKNGEQTVSLNGKYLYSKYRPTEDAAKFIVSNVNIEAEHYILLGLGLGYHLMHLESIAVGKKITVVLLNEDDYPNFMRTGKKEILSKKNLELVRFEDFLQDPLEGNYQILIPYTFLTALRDDSSIRLYFEAYKLNEMSYNSQKDQFHANYECNMALDDPSIKLLKKNFQGQVACLVSAGPSIDQVLPILKKIRDKVCIVAVGASLRILLNNDIKPDLVVISDPKWAITWQFHGLDYDGPLFYLSTACHDVVKKHVGQRYIIFQEGLKEAEHHAKSIGVETLSTGGSVATSAFSLIEYLGFSKMILCGQDLGFKEGKTHSIHTTSGVSLNQTYSYREIEANSGEMIKISKSLFMFYQWFNKAIPKTKMDVYNTAFDGAKINGAQYINEADILQMCDKLPNVNYSILLGAK